MTKHGNIVSVKGFKIVLFKIIYIRIHIEYFYLPPNNVMYNEIEPLNK